MIHILKDVHRIGEELEILVRVVSIPLHYYKKKSVIRASRLEANVRQPLKKDDQQLLKQEMRRGNE